MAINLAFLTDIYSAITEAKLYAEYAGEDLYAKWQSDDSQLQKDLWVGPFGFELLDTGILTGIQLYSENSRFIFEYAQNYKSHYLFYDPYNGNRPYNLSWYSHSVQPPFLNNGALMGHHMGSAAEMLSVHYTQILSEFTVSLLLSRRHRWHVTRDSNDIFYKAGSPERQNVLSSMISRQINHYTLSLNFTFNQYKNVDQNMNEVINRPEAGVKAVEYLLGVTLKVDL
jgi:hypothetical protein